VMRQSLFDDAESNAALGPVDPHASRIAVYAFVAALLALVVAVAALAVAFAS
jgi:hypothetical protein